MKYPNANVIYLDALSVALVWAMAPIGIVFYYFLNLEALAILTIVIFFLGILLHIVLAFLHRCPVCEKHPTIQGFAPPHEASVGQSYCTGWAGVVVSVLRRHKFVCIHCGTKFDL